MPSPKASVANSIRRLVNRSGFDVIRDNFRYRFVYAMNQRGVQTVLDIGANVGQFGCDLRRAKFAGSIVSVEPLAAAYRQLQEQAAADPAWTTERAAVSDQAGTLTMNIAGNSVSSSVLPMLTDHIEAAPQARYVSTEEVPATTVDDLVARHRLDPASTLLKIDVQGYEKSVLDGAAQTLEQFAGVRTEMSLVPLYEGQALLPEILAYLDKHGFDLWQLERGFTDPQTRRTLQLDGVFFRRTESGPGKPFGPRGSLGLV